MDIVELYKSGFSLRQLCPIINVKCCTTVKKILLRKGVTIRGRKEQLKITIDKFRDNDKISKALKGRIRTKQHCKNISKANLKLDLPKEYFIKEYIHKNKSCREIAESLNVCTETIRNYLIKFNIKRNQLSDYDGYWKGRKNPELTARNLTNNPAKRHDVRKKKSELYKANPKLQINSKLRRNKKTNIEIEMKRILDIIGLIENKDYLFNKYLKTRNGFKFPDFRLINKKVIIECDGSYWHSDECKEMLRDQELKNIGYTIYHFNEDKINNSLIPILKKII
ncbi:MAG: endonuclease domain-containing protein [Nanoarchaeota archaeon]|nr:endonuclease domain-containing protein [Nanoarchaeota archaeon]